MKKVVIINSTPRKGGNSEILAKEFEKGAKESGNEVEFYTLRDMNFGFCKGCLACHKTNKCVIADDFQPLAAVLSKADVLVFASPVYYYSVCGQLKTFLDRMNPIYSMGHSFKDVYLISTAAENEKSAVEGSISDIQGWVDCFDGVKIKGVVYGIGADTVGSIKNNEQALADAYEKGKNV